MNTPLFLTFGFILRKGIGCDFNYDVCAFLLDENKKIPQDDFFVFYNNAKSPDGAVELCMEDWNKQWCINDEDFAEDMFIDLSKIDTRIQEIVFTITDEIVSGIYKPTMQNVESFILRIVTRSNNQLFP